MQRHVWTLAATTLAFALAGCPGKSPTTPTTPGKSAGPGGSTSTAATLAALNGSVTAPSGIVAQGAGNVVAQGGGNIVASGAGNIVASGAGNIVASGAGNRRVLAAGGPLGGTVVILVNATTLAEVARTKTDAKGAYSFGKLTPGASYRVLAAGLQDGAPVTLSTMAKPGTKAADIDLASTCCFMACVIKAGNQMNDMDPGKFAAMTAEFAKNLKDGDTPDLTKPANLPHWLGCHFTSTMRTMMQDMVGDMLKQAGLKQQHVLGLGDLGNLSGIVNGAAQQATQAGDLATQAGQAAAQTAQAAADFASAKAQELGKSLGLDMAKAAAELDGCN